MATGLHRPGVYLQEVPLTSVSQPDAPASALAAFVEQTYSGPTSGGLGIPTLISSWNQFVALYGGFADTTKYLPYAVYEFFNNGGAQCVVQRVLGASAVAATHTFPDRAATPQNTVRINAANEGTWGNSLSVAILDRGTNRFDIAVYLGAVQDSNVVERWTDLSMDTTDARYFVSIINSPIMGSPYITVVDLNSASVAPNDRPVVGTSVLSGGTNGSVASSNDYSNALAALDQVSSAILVNLPGQSNSTIVQAAIAYCEARTDAFLIVDSSPSLSTAGVVAEMAALNSTSSYAAMYYPWVQAIDPSSQSRGATKLLPPGAFVAGITIATDLRFGPFKAAAGMGARLQGVVSAERTLSSTDRDTLNDANINAIRTHPLGGIIVFGARTLTKTTATRYVSVRRNLIYIKTNIMLLTEFALFESNDSTTWSLIAQRISQFLTGWWQAGGLRGDTVDQAFYVVCDETNNTQQTIDAGELHATVGVSLEEPAEFIVIQVGQWQGGQAAISA